MAIIRQNRERRRSNLSQSGEIVLSRVVIPEFIVVHDGALTDSTAGDYYVRYRDYIKMWLPAKSMPPGLKAAIRANVLAIMSFTLNRVYTRNGTAIKDLILRSRPRQHLTTNGSTVEIFLRVSSEVVDELLPIIYPPERQTADPDAVLCDGKRVSCPNWMSQWGSKSLADQGYTARNPPLLLW